VQVAVDPRARASIARRTRLQQDRGPEAADADGQRRDSHMTQWTTPAGMKFLGRHQDSAPLEITLVLRRRQGGSN
jgi:hypothetical protein